MQLPPEGQFCSRTQVEVGCARQDGRRTPPQAKATRGGGAAYLRGTLAEGVQAVGVGLPTLPTPPPQQRRPLPGSIGRLRFPDSGRGGCTRPRLRGCPRRRLKGPSRCLKLDRIPQAGPKITIPRRVSMRKSPGPDPFFPGFAFLFPGLSGHHRRNSNPSRVSCPSHACSEIKGGGEELLEGREGAGQLGGAYRWKEGSAFEGRLKGPTLLRKPRGK